MKKLSVAVILAGLLVGCGGDGLVKLENKNPTIDQEIYDLYMEKLSKSEYLHDFYSSLKTSEYNFYHDDSRFEYNVIKEKEAEYLKQMKAIGISDKDIKKDEAKKKEYREEIGKNNGLLVFAVNKKDPEDIYRITLNCDDKCKKSKKVDDVRVNFSRFKF